MINGGWEVAIEVRSKCILIGLFSSIPLEHFCVLSLEFQSALYLLDKAILGYYCLLSPQVKTG